ncbi:MAG: Gfo/Idh/MocA family oxidoreductase [Fimbriimonadaceae bacterium]
MSRIGFAGVAHMHSHGYAHALGSAVSGVWDADSDRAQAFSQRFGVPVADSLESLAEVSDGIIVTSENTSHVPIIRELAQFVKPILCEKPLVTSEDEAQDLISIIADTGVQIMTAFPCRYSPAFLSLKAKISDLGRIRAICATNRGRCPGDWFVQKDKSGGGAMIDHVVHVSDLLRCLLGEEACRVQAQTGNRIHEQEWEDTAMLSIEFPSGIFATLDSSWSRHANFKTWGDVTMNVVGENGTIELDLFSQTLEVYSASGHQASGYGSDIDAGLVSDFLEVVRGHIPPPITAFDGIQAARIAFAGYRSASENCVISLENGVFVSLVGTITNIATY